jgi:hypothetical protein
MKIESGNVKIIIFHFARKKKANILDFYGGIVMPIYLVK